MWGELANDSEAHFHQITPVVDPAVVRERRSNLLRETRSMSRNRNIGTALAAQTAGSPHGPWRLAHSPALQCAFPIAYFDSLGIPRLFEVL